jgi:hypothetical protein
MLEYVIALDLHRIVNLAHYEGMKKVLFTTDCLSLVQHLNSTTKDRSNVGILVDDIKFQRGLIHPCVEEAE